ncbi:MAG: hypothetical protein AB7T10_08585 [bacterium]
MKKVAFFVAVLLLVILGIYADSPLGGGINKNPLNSINLFKPDSQSYSFSTGFLSTGKAYQSYSLFNAAYTTSISRNLTLYYDLSYLNSNLKQNYIRGGLGLSYGKDNFRFSLYMNRVFDKDDYDILH